MSDVSEIPVSFNKTLLDKALLRYTNDPSLQLIDYNIQDNSADISDHFSSIMFKVNLHYKRDSASNDDNVHEINAIVKTLPDVPDQSHNTHLQYVTETAQFDTELKVYEKILPKIDSMLYGMGLNSVAPRQIYQTNHNAPIPILIMEDMVSLGYTTIKDRRQISFDAAKMLIGKLAQLHATSFVLDKQMNETVGQLDSIYFDFHQDISYCEDMDKCIAMMKQFDGFENIVEKLEGKTEELFETVRNLYYSPNDAACKVLCHGDMKFQNTLLKTNGGEVANGIFVDFAYANFHSPAIDLFEFLYKVPALDVIIHRKHRDELINHYMNMFGTVLTGAAFERVDETIENVKNEMDRCDELQLWFLMFLVVYYMDTFDEDSEEDTEILDYEKTWLKTVLGELLKC
ncbi:uncharacterized protein LOC119080054 [Bradysia coprophila]|uniref:uncharacterized protein LOC119080054 n=1 Tax=Bradysia coprophila TaxID=38358 RepID=UPI00187D89DB|nr:uncharacterized protein LOC119080054 [Bradysia coprophila]